MLNQRIAHALSLFDGILRTHANFINSVGLEMSKEDKNLSYLHWTPKLHKTLFKHHFLLPAAVNAQLKTYHTLLQRYHLPLKKDGSGTVPLRPAEG